MNFSSYIDEKLEEMKDQFQKVIVEHINIYFLYVVNQQCEEYKKIVITLKNGTLNKDVLLAEIIKHRTSGGRRFNATGIYKYGFDTEDLATFVNEGDNGFIEYKDVENIDFNLTTDYFQHHNSLFIFLSNEKNKHTKKSQFTPKRKTLKSSVAYEA